MTAARRRPRVRSIDWRRLGWLLRREAMYGVVMIYYGPARDEAAQRRWWLGQGERGIAWARARLRREPGRDWRLP